ncbi:hypothetical protein KUCAC02_022577 [Chaenocephalus aceratus]|uniref:Uncharacterized protein n=1 Tax=Chaenocephalus aceratus TaxID=36190 RepID=A0ACB9XNX8_CHAAC|nr:hypothetical protein KUCAC02_022577 [Chaenocephalus aceratus]
MCCVGWLESFTLLMYLCKDPKIDESTQEPENCRDVTAWGLLKFCTVGFCGIGTLIDFIMIAMQIVGPADGSNYIVDYYGARLTRLSITNQTYRKPHLSL